jgi:hypothetical protein
MHETLGVLGAFERICFAKPSDEGTAFIHARDIFCDVPFVHGDAGGLIRHAHTFEHATVFRFGSFGAS